jgi:hypothetical protein
MKRVTKKKTTRARPAPVKPTLLYKIVELSCVDESALERTVNEWVADGWTFDGVQFAMRESSKRPAMAFVFFTREGAPLKEEPLPEPAAWREAHEAERHLRRLAHGSPIRPPPQPAARVDAWTRLAQLAGEEEED